MQAKPGSVRVYEQQGRITTQRMVAAMALVAYSRGRRLEDEDGEALRQPAGPDSWEGRDCPHREARTERDVADIRTLIRLGADLVPSQVVASCRFRLAAHVARIEKAERTYHRALAIRSERLRSHGEPTQEMLEWPRPLRGDLFWYGWGVRSGAAYGTVHGPGRGCHAGRHSGFGRQMDTGDYGIRMADPPTLAGEWRRETTPPAGMSILIVDDQWVDCAQHVCGKTKVWMVPMDAEAWDQMNNWVQLIGLKVEKLNVLGSDEDNAFDCAWSGAEYYGEDVDAVDADDAWGVARARLPWLYRDGIGVRGIIGVLVS